MNHIQRTDTSSARGYRVRMTGRMPTLLHNAGPVYTGGIPGAGTGSMLDERLRRSHSIDPITVTCF